jgi:hypothetical protein
LKNNKERIVAPPRERKKYSTPVLYTMGVWETLGGKNKNTSETVKGGKIS